MATRSSEAGLLQNVLWILSLWQKRQACRKLRDRRRLVEIFIKTLNEGIYKWTYKVQQVHSSSCRKIVTNTNKKLAWIWWISLFIGDVITNICFSVLCRLFCMCMKLGRSRWGRNVGWGCLIIGCWGEYLGPRGTRQQGSGENYPMRSLMICSPHPISFGWSNRKEWGGRGM